MESKQTTTTKYLIPEYHELKGEKKEIQKGKQEVCENWEGNFGVIVDSYRLLQTTTDCSRQLT